MSDSEQPPLEQIDRDRLAAMLDLTPIPRMTKDILEAAKLLSPEEAVFLVSAYYRMQKNRIRTAHQTRTLSKAHKPHSAIEWVNDQDEKLENRVRLALDYYSAAQPIGEWMRSIVGIGPVISAGLLAGLDINLAPTAGHFWRICGLNPEDKKAKGQKLIWDPQLKRICFLLGESFTKVSAHDDDVYGKIYVARKKLEITNNDAGKFADQARESLATKDFSRDTMARAWYEGQFPTGFCYRYNQLSAEERPEAMKAARLPAGEGVAMLPPARIQLRSQRVAVKMFLADLQAVWHFVAFGRLAPFPWIIEHGGHVHYRHPPNTERIDGLTEALATRARAL